MSSNSLPREFTDILRKEKYQLVGKHSAVKKCRWLHNSLTGKDACYKNKFYGIKSWKCLQMTPTIAQCTMHCLFCWRVQSSDLKLNFNEISMPAWDNPEMIVEGCFRAQERILSGYKVHPQVESEKYLEALKPGHAAISLAGEPTLFPNLSGLVHTFHKKGLTTFIVTNGTLPKALEKLEQEPSQLYVSLTAPDEETFKEVCRPQVSGGWEKLNESLKNLSSFSCPTAIRLTLGRNLNMKAPEKYAQLINKANPTYVEVKSYMFVGMSRLRLQFENMPTHREIKTFANELGKFSSYKILDESTKSRVVLLSRLKKAIKLA
ncbi:MAG: 4-demethylwyosine synthase TYW1 [Candidatus Bathyarchaeota archaeon]